MADEQIDLRRLAEEAVREVYSPRAQACWFPWSHRWSMWQTNGPYYQRRRCIRCGKVVARGIYA